MCLGGGGTSGAAKTSGLLLLLLLTCAAGAPVHVCTGGLHTCFKSHRCCILPATAHGLLGLSESLCMCWGIVHSRRVGLPRSPMHPVSLLLSCWSTIKNQLGCIGTWEAPHVP